MSGQLQAPIVLGETAAKPWPISPGFPKDLTTHGGNWVCEITFFLQTFWVCIYSVACCCFLVHLVCSYSVWPCYMGARSRCLRVMIYAIQQINPQPPSVLLTSAADASKMKLLAFSLQEQQAATVTGVHRQFVYLVITSSAVVYIFQAGILFRIDNATFWPILADFGYFFC